VSYLQISLHTRTWDYSIEAGFKDINGYGDSWVFGMGIYSIDKEGIQGYLKWGYLGKGIQGYLEWGYIGKGIQGYLEWRYIGKGMQGYLEWGYIGKGIQGYLEWG
jgi:hypothetical protein